MPTVPSDITITDDGVTLPVDKVVTGRAFLTGKSGAGKSNSVGVIIEELLERGIPLMIVDTDGEYYGLKERYELIHIGADSDSDVQLGPDHADKIADLALVENAPIILDVSDHRDQDEAKELIYHVVEALFTKEKAVEKPFLLIVEEAHEFIPQEGGLDKLGKTLVQIAKRGRKRGLGFCAVSQRPAAVDKDVITQCDWLVWHRLTWENDTKVVGKILGREYEDQITDLATGEAFLLTDWDEQIRRVTFRKKKTYDAGATPGIESYERPDLKSVRSEHLEELTTFEEEYESDPEVLRSELSKKNARIRELENRVEDLQSEVDTPDNDPDKAPEPQTQGGEMDRESAATATTGTEKSQERQQETPATEPDEFDPLWELGQLTIFLVVSLGRLFAWPVRRLTRTARHARNSDQRS